MNTSTQLKALIRNMSKEKRVQAEILLRNYMLERLLERISLSKYRNKFVLKGGMLIAAMVGIDTRSTMDMDATIIGAQVSVETLEKIMQEIIDCDVDDGVTMKIKGLEGIRDDADYTGIRVSIEAVLDKTRQIMKVDITTGDIITPKEIEYTFKLMLENREIKILAYNLETVLSEKLETILTRGTTNTRMRDFYDIYVITTLRNRDIRWGILSKAFKKTAQNRGSYERILASGAEYMDDIESSDVLKSLWGRYQKKNTYVEDLDWDTVKKSARSLFERIV